MPQMAQQTHHPDRRTRHHPLTKLEARGTTLHIPHNLDDQPPIAQLQQLTQPRLHEHSELHRTKENEIGEDEKQRNRLG